jgi:hypothetical protein
VFDREEIINKGWELHQIYEIEKSLEVQRTGI